MMGPVHSYLFAGGRCSEIATADLTGKTVIVTGASSGTLGYATAEIFLKLGASVIVTSTSLVSAKVAADALGPKCTAGELNLQKNSSIDSFVDFIQQNFPKIDILVNNAGIHLDLLMQWREPKLSEEQIEQMWHTNFLGTFYLTQKLLPILLSTPGARVVNVVSHLHRLGRKSSLISTLHSDGKVILSSNKKPQKFNSWKAYGQSKLAMVLISHYLNKKYNNTETNHQLVVNCCHPGGVFTKVANKGLEGNSKLLVFRRWLHKVEEFILKSPEEGAQTTIYCAISDKAGEGGYYTDCYRRKSSGEDDVGELSYDNLGEALYNETLKYLKLE